MALKKFMSKAGNHVWIDDEQVAAVGTIFTDGTETGEHPDAEPIAYVLLANGESIQLDHSAEVVAQRLGDPR
jgi:hypothetical protein